MIFTEKKKKENLRPQVDGNVDIYQGIPGKN